MKALVLSINVAISSRHPPDKIMSIIISIVGHRCHDVIYLTQVKRSSLICTEKGRQHVNAHIHGLDLSLQSP